MKLFKKNKKQAVPVNYEAFVAREFKKSNNLYFLNKEKQIKEIIQVIPANANIQVTAFYNKARQLSEKNDTTPIYENEAMNQEKFLKGYALLTKHNNHVARGIISQKYAEPNTTQITLALQFLPRNINRSTITAIIQYYK